MNAAINLALPDAVPADPHPAGSRPRILFMGEALAISHVARPAVLAAHLHRRGYDVAFACDPRYQHLIPGGGFPVWKLNSVPAALALERLWRNEPVYDADTLDRYVQEDLGLLRDFQPEVVVGDQRHSLAVSSQLAGVPYINIADGHWCPSTAADFEMPDSPASRIVGMPVSSMLFQLLRPAVLAYHTLPLNTVQMRYGLPAIGPDIKRFFTCGERTVYPNDPALFPLERQLPAGHRFIGPLPWAPCAGLPDWWDSIPADRPVAYVSLGSTGPVGLLESVLRVLGEMPVTVIAATAGRVRLPQFPPTVHVADFLPGAEAARRAALVICNGGSMSAQQALAAGTPYLGLISNMDQLLFSKAVRRTGACEWLRASEADEPALKTLVHAMLRTESYRHAAGNLAASDARWDAPAEFEQVVSAVVRSPGGRMRSSA